MDQAEDKARVANGDSSSVEEMEDALPHCPPPSNYTPEEKEAWVDTAAIVKQCRKEESNVPLNIPSDLDGKRSYAQNEVWPTAKLKLQKLQNMLYVVRCRA